MPRLPKLNAAFALGRHGTPTYQGRFPSRRLKLPLSLPQPRLCCREQTAQPHHFRRRRARRAPPRRLRRLHRFAGNRPLLLEGDETRPDGT